MPSKKDYDKIYRLFELSIHGSGLPHPVREYRFNPDHKWARCRRIDFFFPGHNLAVEIEGGAYSQGRHTRGCGFIADMEKYNEFVMQGFSLLRFTPDQVKSGYALQEIERWFKTIGLKIAL